MLTDTARTVTARSAKCRRAGIACRRAFGRMRPHTLKARSRIKHDHAMVRNRRPTNQTNWLRVHECICGRVEIRGLSALLALGGVPICMTTTFRLRELQYLIVHLSRAGGRAEKRT